MAVYFRNELQSGYMSRRSERSANPCKSRHNRGPHISGVILVRVTDMRRVPSTAESCIKSGNAEAKIEFLGLPMTCIAVRNEP